MQSSIATEIDTIGRQGSPVMELTQYPQGVDAEEETQLSAEEEDVVLRDITGSFADWVASFLRRVILLFENLPEDGATGGTTEGECSVPR